MKLMGVDKGLGACIFCNTVGIAGEAARYDRLFRPQGAHEFNEDEWKFVFSTLFDMKIAQGDEARPAFDVSSSSFSALTF